MVLKNQAIISYTELIKQQAKCEQIGMVKVYAEMVLFDLKLESLPTPRLIDSQGMLFFSTYLFWLSLLKSL